MKSTGTCSAATRQTPFLPTTERPSLKRKRGSSEDEEEEVVEGDAAELLLTAISNDDNVPSSPRKMRKGRSPARQKLPDARWDVGGDLPEHEDFDAEPHFFHQTSCPISTPSSPPLAATRPTCPDCAFPGGRGNDTQICPFLTYTGEPARIEQFPRHRWDAKREERLRRIKVEKEGEVFWAGDEEINEVLRRRWEWRWQRDWRRDMR
ncbi:hypothetical protein Tdes44962_MAKER00172 [Teratosphaeria destructans]|uniref:Uncharacterized protein n=1 Tax=Teratosphaeria destructans TaxID=418781 RepID=A0A9W7SV05_9PEZI|nr:hypothetical protein Tdes44962_MAKER00172 [Teratosphaeria destructans]